MAVTYQDYYKTLGIDRKASQDEIQSAYRKLARKYHPDVNQKPGAEEKFKNINEAYEVLGEPENRKKYDQLGMNWKMGQEFTPPPGWNRSFRGASGGPTGGGFRFSFDDADEGNSGFSDFFDSLFGGLGRQEREGDTGFSGLFNRRRPGSNRGQDHDVELEISLEDAFVGGKRNITLATQNDAGSQSGTTKSFYVTIPKGVADGKRLRLQGQGGQGAGGGNAGDLFLTIRIAKHTTYAVDGKDVEVTVPITPSEAALGATIDVPLVRGKAEIKLPAGIESDKRIRIKGRGLGTANEGKGDLYARIRIVVPPELSPRERELYEQLQKATEYRPRERKS